MLIERTNGIHPTPARRKDPMKTLIVFYSWTGHTGTVAWALGQKLGCPVLRIEPEADFGKHIAKMGVKALFGGTEKIQPIRLDLTGIDHLSGRTTCPRSSGSTSWN
jgi:hypothetical protein